MGVGGEGRGGGGMDNTVSDGPFPWSETCPFPRAGVGWVGVLGWGRGGGRGGEEGVGWGWWAHGGIDVGLVRDNRVIRGLNKKSRTIMDWEIIED